jgi:Cu+-exporting ATPase
MKVRDPVCGMSIEEAEAAATSLHNGRTIYFCAVRCKEKFDANPEKYSNGGGGKAPTVVQIGQMGIAASPPEWTSASMG